MDINEYTTAITDVSSDLRNTEDSVKKAELTSKFWDLAVDAFNEHIAGDIALIDGRTITTPQITRS